MHYFKVLTLVQCNYNQNPWHCMVQVCQRNRVAMSSTVGWGANSRAVRVSGPEVSLGVPHQSSGVAHVVYARMCWLSTVFHSPSINNRTPSPIRAHTTQPLLLLGVSTHLCSTPWDVSRSDPHVSCPLFSPFPHVEKLPWTQKWKLCINDDRIT